jgi:hypothetical protein
MDERGPWVGHLTKPAQVISLREQLAQLLDAVFGRDAVCGGRYPSNRNVGMARR